MSRLGTIDLATNAFPPPRSCHDPLRAPLTSDKNVRTLLAVHKWTCPLVDCDIVRQQHMAKKIAITLRKGGSGKTTTAVNLATALYLLGERVLLVDLDPQANATLAVGV